MAEPLSPSMRFVILHGKDGFVLVERLKRFQKALGEQFGDVSRFDFDGASAPLVEVLDELRTFGLLATHKLIVVDKADQFVADPKKCKFFVKEVEFCGHILGHGTRRPAPGKLMAIEKWELPETITALRAFLGFTNYYSSYIEMYGELVAPLQEKLKVPREIGKKRFAISYRIDS
jgi:hypothetical protein